MMNMDTYQIFKYHRNANNRNYDIFRATPTSSAVVNGAVCSNNWACVGDKFAQCVYGKWIVRPCPGGLVCHEIGAGTSVYCGYPAA